MVDNILICGANWLGDSIMSMPAIQVFKQQHPDCRITMLVKSRLTALWTMHSAVEEVIELRGNLAGTLKTAAIVKDRGFDRAFVFPNSFRSAVIPFLARVPVRIGTRGHQRPWMLTDVIKGEERSVAFADPLRQPASPRLRRSRGYAGQEASAPKEGDLIHQVWEYVNIMGLAGDGGELDVPRICVPEAVVADCRKRLEGIGGTDFVGMIPGAAYGPSKRWPPEYFIEVGMSLSQSGNYATLVFGSENETKLCSQIAEGIGKRAVSLAGETSIVEFAAMLSLCRFVITNDCGGMHLATAVGTRVVAVFGLTDPAKTGPLGTGHRVILQEGVKRSRDIQRDSAVAMDSLRSVGPERVISAVMELFDQ